MIKQFFSFHQEPQETTSIPQRQPWKKRLDELGTVTLWFGVIALVIFMLAQVLMFGMNINAVNTGILLGGQFRDFIVGAHEYWRFITAGFVHTNLIHFASNMFALFSVGSIIEKIYTRKQYIALFFLSILVGSMVSFVFGKSVLSYGMSGALFGLLGAYTVFVFETKAIRIPGVRNQLLMVLLVNLTASIYVNQIDAYAHFGGFLCGVLFALAVNRRPDWYALRKQSVYALAFLVVVMVFLVAREQTLTTVYWGNITKVLEALERLGLKGYADWLFQQMIYH